MCNAIIEYPNESSVSTYLNRSERRLPSYEPVFEIGGMYGQIQDIRIKINNWRKVRQLNSRIERKTLKCGRLSAQKFYVRWNPASFKAQFDK